MNRRHLMLAVAALTLGLAGCASLNQITSEVQSFGQWPADRKPGRYFIERLPSQMAPAGQQDTARPVEEAAHKALQKAGFTRAPDLASADVVVQVGARITRFDISPWNDPLWWRWGPRYWRGPDWPVYRGSLPPRYWRSSPPPAEREVALLLRDRATTLPLWEGRATSSGYRLDEGTFEALFTAALSNFPRAVPQGRSVSVPLPP